MQRWKASFVLLKREKMNWNKVLLNKNTYAFLFLFNIISNLLLCKKLAVPILFINFLK